MAVVILTALYLYYLDDVLAISRNTNYYCHLVTPAENGKKKQRKKLFGTSENCSISSFFCFW